MSDAERPTDYYRRVYPTEDADSELAGYHKLLSAGATLRDINIDAFADGVLAHRAGVAFHDNPHSPDAMTRTRISWSMGWNERALQTNGWPSDQVK